MERESREELEVISFLDSEHRQRGIEYQVSMCAFVCACVRVRVRVSVCLCVCVRVCLSLSLSLCVCIMRWRGGNVSMPTHARAHTHTHLQGILHLSRALIGGYAAAHARCVCLCVFARALYAGSL